MPKVVVIEGPDHVGKTTQVKKIVERLQERGRFVKHIKIPWNDGVIQPIIYWMLDNGLALKVPNTFQALQLLNKLGCQLFEMTSGDSTLFDYIILDRWTPSSDVYGSATGAQEWLLGLARWLLLKPDVTFIITGRKFTRGQDDAYESDVDLQERVTALYGSYAAKHPDVVLITNDGTPDEVCDRIMQSLGEGVQ